MDRFFFKSINVLYAIGALFFLFLISYVANHLYASTIDAHHYSFNETWYNNSALNFKNLNGRWSQGFTNDHRFYIYRIPTTILLNVFFFGSIWYFFRGLLKKWAFVLATLTYFAFLLNAFNVYQIVYLLNTSLSYTLGEGLLFCFYGYALRKGFSIQFKKFNTWLLILLTAFLTGLVEHLFFLNIAVLGFLGVFKWLSHKKIDKGIAFYLLLNGIGAAVTIFSPGLRKRRAQTALRNERLGKDSSIDFNAFFEKVWEHLDLNMTWVTLFLLVFAGVLFYNYQSTLRQKFHFNTTQKAWTLFFILVIPVCPILLGYVGSNGLVGMPKAYNLFAFLIIISTLCFGFFVAVQLPKKGNNKKWEALQYTVALLLIGGLCYSFFGDKKSKLYFQQRQVFSGDIKKPYVEEYARRQYLVETYHVHQIKYIPPLSSSYRGKVDGAHRGLTAPRYYFKRFNKNVPIRISKELPAPRLYTAIFLVENKKLTSIAEVDGVSVYYNATLETVVLKSQNSVVAESLKNNINVSSISKHLWKHFESEQVLDYDAFQRKYPAFAKEYPNYMALELPLDTESFEISAWNIVVETSNTELADNIYYQPNYGNIMR